MIIAHSLRKVHSQNRKTKIFLRFFAKALALPAVLCYHETNITSCVEEKTMQTSHTVPRRVIRVVLTGGITAGKSKMLSILESTLADSAIPAAFVRESATQKIAAGYTPDRFGLTAFQHAVFRSQLEAENRAFRRMLPRSRETGLPVLLICDRGLGDCGAYLPPDTFVTLCRSFDCSRRRLLGRYQGVLFLDSAAVLPSLPFDPGAGNGNRLESDREDALRLNRRTWQAWEDHPNLRHIPAAEDFSRKSDQVLAALAEMLAPWYGEAIREALAVPVR